eukprot:6464072-Prymnesium_polylepis.1
MLSVLELQVLKRRGSRARCGGSSAGCADGAADCARLSGAELADGKRTRRTSLASPCAPPCDMPTSPHHLLSMSFTRFSVLRPATHHP